MTVRRRENNKGHLYFDDDGKLDGVTTLIGNGLPKPALINYAANVTASYAIDHWEQLHQEPVSERVRKLKGARFSERDAAARRGTEVHQLAERLLNGEEVEVPDELAGHVEAYVRFLDQWKPRPVLVETVVASRRWRYAGTLDAVVDLPDDGQRMIVDLKTNRSGIFPETALQLAAYRFAEVYLDTDGNEQPMSELGIVGALGVWLRADGYDVYEITADETQHNKFLHVATVARWAKDSRGLIGESMPAPEVIS